MATESIDHLLSMLGVDESPFERSPNKELLSVSGGGDDAVPSAQKLNVLEAIDDALDAVPLPKGAVTESNYVALAVQMLSNEKLSALLIAISRLNVFSSSFSEQLQNDITRLRALKKLKFWMNFSAPMFFIHFRALCAGHSALQSVVSAIGAFFASDARKLVAILKMNGVAHYEQNRERMEAEDPHSVFPTNIYRVSGGHVVGTEDSQQIEAVMHLSVTTSIRIERHILKPSNRVLRDIYVPFGRCVAIIDDKVAAIYGDAISAYFAAHGVRAEVISFSGLEADKHIGSVQDMLDRLRSFGVQRNEPVLIVGGGVTADIGGFATALYHRSTPYVMLSTSIVSGIDAGPSPRTCCDGFGFKNIFGAYAPPILTLTDCSFFKTLPAGVIRHGIAEIIKMAVVKDRALFSLLERCGRALIATKFGTIGCDGNSEFERDCDVIIGRAMESYVRSEYGNLWETHQCRPHAFGHSWSPGFELPSGMLHGHAVSCGMGYGAFLSFRLKGWIGETEMLRILRLISTMELALWHPIMADAGILYRSQLKMQQKRGGNLCAPVPKGAIGGCGYIHSLSRDDLATTLREYQALCLSMPRKGAGVEPLCKDIGLEDPSTGCPK